MEKLIGIAVLIAGLVGGTMLAEKIYCEVRLMALEKAGAGLPRLSPFAHALTEHGDDLNSASKKARKRTANEIRVFLKFIASVCNY